MHPLYIFYKPATQIPFSILSGFTLSIFVYLFRHTHICLHALNFIFTDPYMHIRIFIYAHTHMFVYKIMFVEPNEKALKAVEKNLSQPQAQNHHLSFATPKSTSSAHAKMTA